MNIIRTMSEQARTNLRRGLHKVAAVMARQEGHNLQRDEVTIKEAAYLIGADFWKHWLEKRALFDGLMSVRQLSSKR